MNAETLNISILALLPIVVLSVFGVAIMVLGPFTAPEKRGRMGGMALVGIVLAALSMMPMAQNRGDYYSRLWSVDEFSLFLHAVFLFIAGLTTLTAMGYLRREKLNHPEFYALLLFATAGMLTMAGSRDLIVLFIGLEILSIATYVLAGFRRTDLKSNESSLKYFLLGSFASAFFLYGIALIFGATGSTNLAEISFAIDKLPGNEMPLVYLSAALMLTALCFKVAAAPFHVWTPDVYEGAPTPVTGFMSVGPKAAGFAVLLRIFVAAFPQQAEGRWQDAVWVIAVLTMAIGNIVALVQPNIKRMLAYSSIAHAGYLAVALAAAGSQQPQETWEAAAAALFYLAAYSATNLAAFGVLAAVGRSEDKQTNLSDLAGLGRKRPGLAAVLTIALLSLAGIPGTAGFAGKFFIFRSAVQSGLVWLAIIGALTTIVSFYYYLYVIVQMYMREPREEFADVEVTTCTRVALAASTVVIFYLGILPSHILDWAIVAATSLISQ